MAKYRKIDPQIHTDAKYKSLSFDARLLFMTVLTHPHMTAVGAMMATPSGLAAEMGMPFKRLSKAFAEVFEKGMLEHDESACFLAAPNFLKYNPPENANVIKGWEKSLDFIPNCDLKNVLIQRVRDFISEQSEGIRKGLAKPFGSLSKGYAIPSRNPEPEPEPEPRA